MCMKFSSEVFDKGWMEDGEGRHIDFRNTIIILTSNVGTELITAMCADPDLMPEPDALRDALRPPLLQVFPPALLGRLLVVPYFPLSDEMLAMIVRLQLKRIQRRLQENHTALCRKLTTAWWNRLFSAVPKLNPAAVWWTPSLPILCCR